MKNLPLGVQTFRDFSEKNYIYVDKTRQIHDLFARGGKYYFLSRPRRFGKSLLISTLAELFSGNKELFKGLWIYDKIEWTQYPVILIDFSKIDYETPEKLKESIKEFLDNTAIFYGVTLNKKKSYKESFVELIEKLSAKGRVIILVDEYDKPIIEYVEAKEIDTAKKIRRVLKNFYGVIKASDAFLHFVFITGVSKFSRVSVFSDLNNLTDITLMDRFSTLLGYTEAELEHYFSPYMEQMVQKRGMSRSYLSETIHKWYNGYSWDGENFVYNPYSILNLFNANKFENYWFSTGTPTFLTRLIKSQKTDITEFENLPVKSYTFDSYDIENLEIPALLFQTGYLTVKKITVKGVKETFHLSYPNQEVRDSFLTHLFGELTQKKMNLSTRVLDRMREAVEADDMERFVQEIKALFASIPQPIFIDGKEAYYHSIIYLVLRLNGAEVRAEDPTNIGRIDAVVETEKKIYIMEFKMGSEQKALEQIKDKKYYEKYLGKGKEIVLMGIGIDPNERNIGNYLLESP
ncbi:MAG: AAA family ATPase [Candidatus Aminicenantes bacterium]|nr:AAA family ATPase [Candidatus Aminicenantes bacterium]NIM81513.1 AAA family ATPase [Candidatus Aminicenantes bacterium]NIN20883.1 AAA family ATPase [Candidatus Aminicenantes bacterium]NIN44704.1 AAA family ATPase [Candidatus Aminicenantes bacterium]NIN87512.1 AAA family ATPase [Candidatus Aminicenantes bacterium]